MSTSVDQDTPVAVQSAGELVEGLGQRLVTYQDADAETRSRLNKLMAEIDLQDTNSIIFFGTKAQQQLTTISDQMLEGVRNKDTGPAGSALNEMVGTLRGFDVSELDPNQKRGLLARLFGSHQYHGTRSHH